MLNTGTGNQRIIVLDPGEDLIIEETRRTCDQNNPRVVLRYNTVRVVSIYGCFQK